MSYYFRSLVFTWNICRIVRIFGSIPFIVAGIKVGHWPTVVFGSVFAALGLFYTRCCASTDCSMDYSQPVKSNRGTVEFEEIK